jgi:hypothetical protein
VNQGTTPQEPLFEYISTRSVPVALQQTWPELWGSPSFLVRPGVQPLLGAAGRTLIGYTRPKRAPTRAPRATIAGRAGSTKPPRALIHQM